MPARWWGRRVEVREAERPRWPASSAANISRLVAPSSRGREVVRVKVDVVISHRTARGTIARKAWRRHRGAGERSVGRRAREGGGASQRRRRSRGGAWERLLVVRVWHELRSTARESSGFSDIPIFRYSDIPIFRLFRPSRRRQHESGAGSEMSEKVVLPKFDLPGQGPHPAIKALIVGRRPAWACRWWCLGGALWQPPLPTGRGPSRRPKLSSRPRKAEAVAAAEAAKVKAAEAKAKVAAAKSGGTKAGAASNKPSGADENGSVAQAESHHKSSSHHPRLGHARQGRRSRSPPVEIAKPRQQSREGVGSDQEEERRHHRQAARAVQVAGGGLSEL